jgi:hypothetical protein
MMGMPDTREKQVLLRISAQVEHDENPAELTFYEVVQEPDGHYLRFMKVIDTKSMCLACHGEPDAVANAVKTSLQDNYPHDRAVGYVAGELHGAVSIKQPLHE